MRIRRLVCAAAVGLLAVAGIAQPASAALPDRFGFALFSGGVVSEAFPAATTVSPNGVGRWVVRFPGVAAPGGVVHVTAVHNALAAPPGRWCQTESFGVVGADEIVKVACYRAGGFLDSGVGFSVQWSRSSGVFPASLFGYLDSSAAGAVITSYNSVGGPVTVANVAAGVYSVAFSGLGTAGPQAGSLQVTAVNPATGARCKLAGWQSSANGQFLRIYCFNSAGVQTNNRFNVTYQYKQALYGGAFPPGRFGYLWNVPPLGPPLTAYDSAGPAPALAFGPPIWTASFPNIAAPPGNVQVTAYGTTPDFCGLHQPWINGASLTARINCFNNAGAVVNSGFLVEYSSRF